MIRMFQKIPACFQAATGAPGCRFIESCAAPFAGTNRIKFGGFGSMDHLSARRLRCA